jgi:Uma2 family endonuclease
VVVAQPGLTLEQFLQLPERKPALEYEDGVITQKVSPKIKHARIQSRLAVLFEAALPPGTAHVLTEARFSLPPAGRSYVPDVSVYLWDRIPADADDELVDDVFETPDVAVEILSPKQAATPAIRRCHWYVANGAKVALFVDPKDHTVLVIRPDGATQVVRGDDPIDLTEVLPALRLTATEPFASLRHAKPDPR